MKLYEVEGHARKANGVTIMKPLFVSTDLERALGFGAATYQAGGFDRVLVQLAMEERKITVKRYE